MVSPGHERLLTGPQASADQYPVRAEHHGCRQTASICDPACGEQMRFGHVHGKKIGDLGHETQRSTKCPMSASLGALRNHNISADVDGIPDMIEVLALTDELRARIPNFIDEGSRIAERYHDSRWPILENAGQQ